MNGPPRRLLHDPSSRKATKAHARPTPEKGPRCPVCGKPSARDHHPFCSRHCADVDLGRWLGGRYAIPGERLGRGDAEMEDE